MQVVIIGGAGTVGATTAYSLAVERPNVDITLVDVAEDVADGHAIDLTHARTISRLPQFENSEGIGTVDATPSRSEAVTNADVIVVAASVPRPSDAAERGGRALFLERNRKLTTTIANLLKTCDSVPVVVVTNPVDRITYLLWQETGWDRRHFLGYSLSETARAADKISDLRESPASSIYCPVAGEHGEDVVPLFSRLTIDGEPVSLPKHQREAVRRYIRNIPYDIIDLRGEAETSRWVTGRGVAGLTQAILDGGIEGGPIALSTPLDGEYGFTDVSLSVPIEFGRNGVDRVLEWELSEEEYDRLDAASESINDDL